MMHRRRRALSTTPVFSFSFLLLSGRAVYTLQPDFTTLVPLTRQWSWSHRLCEKRTQFVEPSLHMNHRERGDRLSRE